MVQVRVAGLVVDPQSQPVVILKPIGEEPGHGKLLPIWIGPQEATAIMLAVQGQEPPRPLPYDLMRGILDVLDATVESVEVTKIEEGTFYAQIALRTREGVRLVDARPSDSIALATRTDAPIWVADTVLDQAGIDDETDTGASEEGDEGSPGEGATTLEEEEAEVARFTEFLEQVDPEDFKG